MVIFYSLIEFQSTLPLREATLDSKKYTKYGIISIHAPLTGSDLTIETGKIVLEISIHAPLTGSDIQYYEKNKSKI